MSLWYPALPLDWTNPAKTVREVRKFFGDESQTKFAARLQCCQRTISRWETGETEPDGPARVAIESLIRTHLARR
jgi:DNA-binding transcriptional regulator YiaG